MYLLLALCLMAGLVNSFNLIKLNTTNVLTIQGQIDSTLASKFIYDLNKRKNKKGIYIYINSQGGSVESGNQIILEIQKYKLDCIVERAYSMGFVILQACNKRYIRPYGKLMQHQMSYGIMNEKEKVESYVNFVKQMDEVLTQMQTDKIQISNQQFKEKTYNEWWMFGNYAIENNCADEIVHVSCDDKLTKQNETQEYNNYELIFSKCPLIEMPIEVKKLKSNLAEYF